MKKNILIIGPSLKMGGIERASSNMANVMRQNHDFHIYFIAFFRQEKFFKLDSGIEFFEPSGFNETKINFSKSILWMRSVISKINPDTILVFNYFYGAIIRLALSGKKYPLYISDRASPLYQWPRQVKWFNDFIYKLLPPSGIVAQTGIAADYKRKFFKNRTRIKVIPNALREVMLYPEIKREQMILAVGRLGDPLKGFDRLINVMALLKNLDWNLVIAGGDEDGEYLKKQAADLGIENRIVFLGKVKEIDKVYAKSGIFVIPSRSEGFPNALCEAMAAGLPCVSFDFVAGPRDIITDGFDGLIVENGNVQALAEKLDFLIENEDERKRLSDNAIHITERLNQLKIGNLYLQFILGEDE